MRHTMTFGTILVAVVLVAGGCDAGEDRAAPPRVTAGTTSRAASSPTSASLPSSPFGAFAGGTGKAWNDQRFRSLNELVINSDVVFVGTVTGARWVTLPGDRSTTGTATNALIYELEVGRVFSTTGLTARHRQVDVVLDLATTRSRLDPPIGDNAVFFLQRWDGPAHLYRPTSSLGVLDLDEGHLAFPLGGAARWATKFLDQGWRQALHYIGYFTPQYPY